MKPLVPALVAEFIGTFALCFFGVGAVSASSGNLLVIALAHGLVLAAFISGCMYISQGLFNPAVAVGLVLAGKETPVRAALLIATQIVGAIVGTWAIALLVSNSNGVRALAAAGTTSRLYTDMGLVGRVVGLEAICIFVIMFVALSTVMDDRAHKLGGVCVGLMVTICILTIGPYTGASMNPARTLGPAVIGGNWTMWYAYMIGPAIGACAAALVYRLFWVDRWSKPT